MKKYVLIPDSFKGTLSSADICRIAAEEIRRLERQMKEASKMLEFEYAAVLRDQIRDLRRQQEEAQKTKKDR